MTKRLIRIPSVFGDEDAIGEFIASHLSRADVLLQKVPGFPPNVIARKVSDEHAPTIVLNGHMDTIRPLASWERDPFKPRMKGNMLYGLGASDMKGGLAVLMNAFQRADNDRINLVFVATVDEEGVCSGAYRFAEEHGGHLCIVGEPSGYKIILGARGRFVLDVIVEGKAAHGARPEEGTNPIDDMGTVLKALTRIRTRKHRSLGSGSLTPLEIDGGEGSLTVPEKCRLVVDRHTVLGETQDMILRDFRMVMSSLGVDSRISVSMTERETPFLEPYLTDRRDRLVKRFIKTVRSDLGREPAVSCSKSVGDYNVFGSRMPTVIFGPVGKGSHSSQERLDVRSLSKCEDILTRFLNSL